MQLSQLIKQRPKVTLHEKASNLQIALKQTHECWKWTNIAPEAQNNNTTRITKD